MTTARDQTNRLAELLRRERHAMSEFLLALSDFDRQRLWLELGHASLFSFLRRELCLSAGAAQYRKTAAELVQRHPEVEAALRAGELCLSSVIELAKVLTPENVAEILPRFYGLSSRDAAAVAVSIRPVESAPVREVLQPIALDPVPDRAESQRVRAPEVPRTEVVAPAPVARAALPRPSVDPLDADHARLHLTVSRRLLAKLEAAKAALSHARPGASSEEVLEAALDALLAQRAKRRGMVEKPRAVRRPASPDTVTAAAKREVWARSGGACEWPVASGGRCGSTLRLEIDHVTPRALGGKSTIDNLRITCRVHNQLAARNALGDACMDRFSPKSRAAERNGDAGRPVPASREPAKRI